METYIIENIVVRTLKHFINLVIINHQQCGYNDYVKASIKTRRTVWQVQTVTSLYDKADIMISIVLNM